MDNTRSFPGFDFDGGYDVKVYPCFYIKQNAKTKEVEIYRNNKCLQKIAVDKFPKDLDLNDVNTISNLIKVVREEGIVGLMNKYQLQ